MNSVRSNNVSFKYQRFAALGSKGKGIINSEFVAKTQFLKAKLLKFFCFLTSEITNLVVLYFLNVTKICKNVVFWICLQLLQKWHLSIFLPEVRPQGWERVLDFTQGRQLFQTVMFQNLLFRSFQTKYPYFSHVLTYACSTFVPVSCRKALHVFFKQKCS